MENLFVFPPTNIMKLHALSEKLNNIFVANLKWQPRGVH